MVLIDDIDRRLVYEIERNARTPEVKLAKLVHKSKDAVRYRIRKLEELGIITAYQTWIDYSKLGYRTATIYLTLLNIPARKQQLINQLKADPCVYWMGIAEGVWNVGFTYFIRNNIELFELKNNLVSQYSDLIIESRVTTLVSVNLHVKRFLYPQGMGTTSFGEETVDNELDEASRKVLLDLHVNSRANIASIAAKHKLTPDVVRQRIRRMEQLGIIVRYTIDVNYLRLGYEFYKAFVYLKTSTRKQIDEILRYCERTDNIINVVKQIAPWDLELIIFARSFKEYNDVIGAFTQRFSTETKKVETAVMSEDIMHPSRKLIFE